MVSGGGVKTTEDATTEPPHSTIDRPRAAEPKCHDLDHDNQAQFNQPLAEGNHSGEKKTKNKLTAPLKQMFKRLKMSKGNDKGINVSCPHEVSAMVSQQSIPPDHLPLFVAKYDYITRESGDLTIKRGDQVYIVDDKEEGWWLAKAKSSGEEGFIPRNYVVEFESSFDTEE